MRVSLTTSKAEVEAEEKICFFSSRIDRLRILRHETVEIAAGYRNVADLVAGEANRGPGQQQSQGEKDGQRVDDVQLEQWPCFPIAVEADVAQCGIGPCQAGEFSVAIRGEP